MKRKPGMSDLEWREACFDALERSAQMTLRALMNGEKLPSIKVSLTERQLADFYLGSYATGFSEGRKYVEQGAEATDFMAPAPAKPICTHQQRALKLVTDSMAVCWKCGEAFDVERM